MVAAKTQRSPSKPATSRARSTAVNADAASGSRGRGAAGAGAASNNPSPRRGGAAAAATQAAQPPAAAQPANKTAKARAAKQAKAASGAADAKPAAGKKQTTLAAAGAAGAVGDNAGAGGAVPKPKRKSTRAATFRINAGKKAANSDNWLFATAAELGTNLPPETDPATLTSMQRAFRCETPIGAAKLARIHDAQLRSVQANPSLKVWAFTWLKENDGSLSAQWERVRVADQFVHTDGNKYFVVTICPVEPADDASVKISTFYLYKGVKTLTICAECVRLEKQ